MKKYMHTFSCVSKSKAYIDLRWGAISTNEVVLEHNIE